MILGEEGSEQFTVTVATNGESSVSVQPIHDPFIRTRVQVLQSRFAHFKGLFSPRYAAVAVKVSVDATAGAQRAILTLDPAKLAADTDEILEARRISRELNYLDTTCAFAATESK